MAGKVLQSSAQLRGGQDETSILLKATCTSGHTLPKLVPSTAATDDNRVLMVAHRAKEVLQGSDEAQFSLMDHDKAASDRLDVIENMARNDDEHLPAELTNDIKNHLAP